MKWGALLNKKPTNKKIEELNNILPHTGHVGILSMKKTMYQLLMVFQLLKKKKIL